MHRFKSKAQLFFDSLQYAVLLAVLVWIGHSSGADILVCGIMLAVFLVGCLVCERLSFAIPFFCFTFFLVTIEHGPNVPNYSDYYWKTPILWILIAYVALLVIGLLVFAVRNASRAKKPNGKGLLSGLLLFCVTLLTNGLFSEHYTVQNLLYAIAFGGILMGVFLLFGTYCDFDRCSCDRFVACLVLTGLLICSELLFAYATTVRFADGSVVKESVVLGWGVWTTIGGLLCLFMPASFYFAASHPRGWFGIVSAVLHLFCILLSQSRGALLVGIGIFVLCTFTLCWVGARKKQNRIFACGMVIVGAFACVCFRQQLLPLIRNFLQYGFDDNGRFSIWQAGKDHFLRNPVFGSGFYDSYTNDEWEMSVAPYLYHNTWIQMLAANGILGFTAYWIHRVQTICLICKKPTAYSIFLGFGILGMLLFSLLDVLFFNLYPMIFYALMLLFAEKREADQ